MTIKLDSFSLSLKDKLNAEYVRKNLILPEWKEKIRIEKGFIYLYWDKKLYLQEPIYSIDVVDVLALQRAGADLSFALTLALITGNFVDSSGNPLKDPEPFNLNLSEAIDLGI